MTKRTAAAWIGITLVVVAGMSLLRQTQAVVAAKPGIVATDRLERESGKLASDLDMDQHKTTTIRSTITDDEFGGFRITIPASRPDGCVLGAGLGVWAAVAAISVAYFFSGMRPDHGPSGDYGFLALLALAGVLLALIFIHAHTAREVVIIDGKTLVLRSEFAGTCRAQVFDLAGIRNLRAVRSVDVPKGSELHANAVAFDHCGKTHHFGAGLSGIEVIRLVKTVRQRFSIKDDLDDAEPLPIIT